MHSNFRRDHKPFVFLGLDLLIGLVSIVRIAIVWCVDVNKKGKGMREKKHLLLNFSISAVAKSPWASVSLSVITYSLLCSQKSIEWKKERKWSDGKKLSVIAFHSSLSAGYLNEQVSQTSCLQKYDGEFMNKHKKQRTTKIQRWMENFVLFFNAEVSLKS